MKKLLLTVLAGILFVLPAGAVEINSVNFPDETFRDMLLNDFDTDGDGQLSQEEITQITQITANGAGISSLDGIEYLTALEYLDCGNNHLALLDLSSNTNLTDLICAGNQLIWLNIDNCSGLEFLSAKSNDIAELNISGCPKLYSEDIGGKYSFFFSYDEDITAIVFEHVPDPTQDAAPSIRAISLPYAEAGLTFSFTPSARGTEPITWSIASGHLPDGLTLSGDKISGVPQVSGDFSITLRAENPLGYDEGAVTISVADTVTVCSERFPDEKFRAYLTAYERDTFDGDGRFSRQELAKVTEIDITGGISVIVDDVQFSGKIESLAGIEYFYALEKLFCNGNNLSDINLSGNASVRYVQCKDNRINFLDVMNCGSLVSLDCSANRINMLDLSGNTALEECHCDNNPLYSLNIDGCTKLSELSLTGTGLPKLNVGGCPELYAQEEETYTYGFAFDDDVTQIVFDSVAGDPFVPRLPPVISSDTLRSALASRSYMSHLNASGAGPVIWSLEDGTLPEGLSLDKYGIIYGIPVGAGKSSFTVKASNDYGADTGTFTLQVMESVSITTESLKAGTIGKHYSAAMQADGTKPIAWSAEGLPSGLKISERVGRVYGRAKKFGEFTVRFVAENDAGSAQAILPLTVKGIPPKLSGRLAKAELSQPYSSGLRLSKGSTPITWSISGNLPEGVSLDTTTGIISGTPVSYSRSGFRVRITASNEAGSKTKSVRLMVKGTRPQITTASLPDAKLRRTYTASLTAEGSEPVTWSAVNLPAGLTISGDMITGTATQTGTFRVRLCAKNPVKSVRKTLTLNVSETTDTRLPVFSQYEGDSSQNAGGTSSSSYTQAYAYQTGTGNISGGYVIVGELGVISCDEAGLYEFGITLSDDAYEGSELIYIANSDSPSEDDDIADFYDETGEEISAVPEDRRIIISIWLNPGTVYHPVIAVKR